MAAKRDAIVTAVKTALDAASVSGTTKPTGLNVYRMRERPIQTNDLPAIVILLAGERPDRDASNRTDRTLRIVLECRVEAGDTVADTALDALLVWVVKAMMTDYTLGARVNNIVEGETTWDIEERADSIAAAMVEFEIMYQTAYNDPESAG